MRAVQFTRPGEVPFLVDLPEPTCPDDGVLVRVGATGVCRSDWHAWVGHDLAGTVAGVGADVRGWSVGDRVTVPFVCACGSCPPCREGAGQVCLRQTQPGFT